MACPINRIALCRFWGALLLLVGISIVLPGSGAVPLPQTGVPTAAPLNWQTPARWCHGMKKTRGTLTLADTGIEFRPAQGSTLQWRFKEIQTFDLTPRQLRVTGYENRPWHFYGERSFRFEMQSAMPPRVAVELAARVAKPAENGEPDVSAPAFATLDARHRTRAGGTNGVLRFRNSGIDYVTGSGEGARSWRWADIQTLARPDAFHFRVGAYREISEFELKEPMSTELFDRLWNDVYARDLGGVNPKGGSRP
jgi:hypothetical protein